MFINSLFNTISVGKSLKCGHKVGSSSKMLLLYFRAVAVNDKLFSVNFIYCSMFHYWQAQFKAVENMVKMLCARMFVMLPPEF